MSEVEEDRLVPGADFRKDGGDELLALQFSGQTALQALPQLDQVRLVMGGLTERAEHYRCRLDRGETLALHVADDHTDAVR